MARLLKSSNQFTAYNFYPIEVKFGRMILDISSLDFSEPDFSDFLLGGAVEARLLRSSNRFTGYSIRPIELKLGGRILDISPHNPHYLISSQMVLLWARLLRFSNRSTA